MHDQPDASIPTNATTRPTHIKTPGFDPSREFGEVADTLPEDALIEAAQRTIDQRRLEARAEQRDATGEFRETIVRMADHADRAWSAVTPEQLAADHTASRQIRIAHQQRKRQADWEKLVAERGCRYADCRLANFAVSLPEQQAVVDALRDYGTHLGDHVSAGRGLILHGPTGTGKDHLLTAMLRCAILQHGFTVAWVNGPLLWSGLRDRIDSGRTESDFTRPLVRADILAISDPTPGALTAYQAEVLYRVIDHRYSNRRPVWITANAKTRATMEQLLGSAALVERLVDGALVLPCLWPSYRHPLR